MVDFTSVLNGDIKLIDLARDLSLDDLRTASDQSIDTMLEIITDLTDEDITFDPVDPEANDPYAIPGEENIGWNIAHVIVHVTASTEEGAAISSMLARGFPTAERPRYETPWRQIVTKAQCIQRLEESRRIRRAYLNTWPDTPHLEIYREVSERFTERFGLLNAPAAFLFGLKHEVGHHDQIREVARQAWAARQARAAQQARHPQMTEDMQETQEAPASQPASTAS